MTDSRNAGFEDVRSALASPDRVLLALTLVFFSMWLGSAGPLRWWASEAGIATLFVFGVAPSFFAGATLTCWQSLATRTGPITSAAFALALTVLGEAAQIVLPGHTPDLWDIVAGALGALLAVPLVAWRVPRPALR